MTSDTPMGRFAHLGFARWPFSLVPLPGEVRWYGRETVKVQVDRLLWRLERVPNTSLHLIWADVGSGKTHTLRYMEHQIASSPGMSSALVLMPRGAKGFLDLYAAIARAIDFEAFAAVLASHGFDGTEARVLTADYPDTLEAARAYWMGLPQDRALVREWLTGSRSIPIRDLRRVGISQPLRTFDAVTATLEILSKVILSRVGRFVLMIDEAQRIGTVRSAVTAEICAGLQSWYNAVPSGLSIVMAFSFGDEAHLRAHLTPELLSREDPNRVSLPALTPPEATQFISSMVEDARIPGSPTLAMDAGTVSAGIAALVAQGVAMTPRNLIKAFDSALGEIDFIGSSLTDEEVSRLLAGISFDAGEVDD